MNKKIEFGLRSSVYIFLCILLFFFFELLKRLIIRNTSIPYWVDIINLKTAIICFFIIIACFEIWLLYYNKIKRLFLKNECIIYLIIIIIFLMTNLILQFGSPTAGDIRYPARIGYLISEGYSPYFDFFEHHNPLYGYIISPIFMLFNGLTPLYSLHILSFLILVLSCFFIYKMGLFIFQNKQNALLSVLFFLSFKNILVSYNIRQDIFAALFLIIGTFYVIKADSYKDYMTGGILTGISFLFVQKSMLHVLGIALLLFISNRKKIFSFKRAFSFISGVCFPLFSFYGVFYLFNGFEGLRKYYILNFLLNYQINWGFNVHNEIASYFITNGFHIFFIFLGTILILKYHNKIRNFRTIFLIILLNLAIFLFFMYKRITPQDFMYFIPILTICGIISLKEIYKKTANVRIEKYLWFFGMIVLLILPFMLTVLNLTVPRDNHEIEFYLSNFSGEPTNCNFIYNPLDEYHWTHYSWWDMEDGAANFFVKHGFESRQNSIKEMIEKEYKIICIGGYLESAEKSLLEKGYLPYKHNDIESKTMFVKKNGL